MMAMIQAARAPIMFSSTRRGFLPPWQTALARRAGLGQGLTAEQRQRAQGHHQLVLLIEYLAIVFHETAIGAVARRHDLDHLCFGAQHVAGAYRPDPADTVDA